MKTMKTLVALAAAFAACASASAQPAFYSGDTTGGPTMNRPVSLASLSGVGTAVAYSSQAFHVTVTGSYVMEVLSTTAGYDPYLLLYAGSFSAASPLVGLQDGDDDYTGAFTVLGGAGSGLDASRIASTETSNFNDPAGSTLVAGTQYYMVVTGFANDDFGTFDVGIGGGPGRITLGMVPAPGALALLGLAGLVGSRRRRVA